MNKNDQIMDKEVLSKVLDDLEGATLLTGVGVMVAILDLTIKNSDNKITPETTLDLVKNMYQDFHANDN